MSHFVIHRGTIISVIQAIFSCVFFFVAIPLFNGWLMLGYATVFTTLPVFCLVFDEDVSYEAALEYPELYKSLQSGRDMNFKNFLIWMFKSIYQGSVIMILSLLIFSESFYQIVTITFTSLIIAELLNTYSELNKLKPITFGAQLLTLGFYIFVLKFEKQYINAQDVTVSFIVYVVIITLISWIPIHALKVFARRADPADFDKIMKSKRRMKRLDKKYKQMDFEDLEEEEEDDNSTEITKRP